MSDPWSLEPMGPSRLLIWILGCKPTQLGAGGFPRNKQGVGVLWSLHSLKGLWFVPNKVYEPLRWYRPSRLRLSCRSSRRCLRCLSRNARMIVGWSPESSPAQPGWSLCLSLGFRSNFCFRFCFSFCYCLCFRIWVCRWTTTTEKKEKTRRGEVEVGEDQGQRLAALPHRLRYHWERLPQPLYTHLNPAAPHMCPSRFARPHPQLDFPNLGDWSRCFSLPHVLGPQGSVCAATGEEARKYSDGLKAALATSSGAAPATAGVAPKLDSGNPLPPWQEVLPDREEWWGRHRLQRQQPVDFPKVLFKIPTTDWMLCPCTLGL